jgi:methanogenic corrinoid protein MtbC1
MTLGNIVAMLLRSLGFEISDLGTDVSAEDIAKSVKERRANILSPSALLTTSVSEFGNVMSRLQREGLNGIVKTVLGGAAVTEKVLEYDVNAWAKTAVDGLRTCRDWTARG